MAEQPERRRRRPAVSCATCRKRKLRCDRQNPCSNCVRSRDAICVYDNSAPLSRRLPLSQGQATPLVMRERLGDLEPVDSVSESSQHSTTTGQVSTSRSASGPGTATPATPPTQASLQDVASMRDKIRQLEEQLSASAPKEVESPASYSASSIVTATSRLGGTYYFHREASPFGSSQLVTRSVTHKSRFFGQSHWINGIAMVYDTWQLAEPLLTRGGSKAFTDMEKCKKLARVIKSRRAPSWPCPPTSDLPPRETTDELVDCYLRTTETVYRILHIPTFKRDYQLIWQSDNQADTAFLVQLKLVLAIGAVTYDDKFSLRSLAVRWIYEAQTWIAEPEFKARLGIQYIQNSLLLMLAGELVNIGDSAWITGGSIFRRAVSMGLHRDPISVPKRSVFVTEMRRRLWNTILEVALQASLTSGGPPLISIDDFDTSPPGNFDDEQITTEDPLPRSDDEFTQMSIAIVLRQTYPIRLAVAKFLNDLKSSGTYEETLRLDKELRAAYKIFCRQIQGYNSGSGQSSSHFEIRFADFLVNRFLCSLHIPRFGPALRETTYAYSRKVAVETALKLWFTASSNSAINATPCHFGEAAGGPDYLERLATCGSGVYRSVAMQAALLIALELRTQLQEREGLVSVPLRPDFLACFEGAKAWTFRSIEAGETNVKGYVFLSAISAEITGLTQNLEIMELAKLMINAMEEAESRCLPLLESMASEDPAAAGSGGAGQQRTPGASTGFAEDWDFMMTDTTFDPRSADAMNWIFNDDVAPGDFLW